MKNIKQTLLIGLALVGFSASPFALAQSNPAASVPAAGMPELPGHSPQDMEKWHEKMKERAIKHQAELHDRLKITPAQEPAWKTFTQAMTPPSMPEHMHSQDQEKLSTPERMALSLERMKKHEAFMQTRLEAVKTFYAALTPDQQKTFDESHKRMQKEMQERMAKQMEKGGRAGTMERH